MKFKITYTITVLTLCALLGWALVYELKAPQVTATNPHPTTRTVWQLIAPNSSSKNATTTVATTTPATTTPPIITVSTSTVPHATTTPKTPPKKHK